MTTREATALIHPAADLLPRKEHPHQWADLGCGTGLFTEALAGLLPEGSTIYGVDTRSQLREYSTANGIIIRPVIADFVKDALPYSPLDGILMANSLHYVNDKPALLQKLRAGMRADAPLLLVEYDIDKPVPAWVPYPISYALLKETLGSNYKVHKLGERHSAYGRGKMYAAIAIPTPPIHSPGSRKTAAS